MPGRFPAIAGISWLRGLSDGVERLKGVVLLDTGPGGAQARLLNFVQGQYELTRISTNPALYTGTIVAICQSGTEGRIGRPE